MKAFETWRKGESTFLAFPGDGKVYVMDDEGNNYGTWYSIDSFRDSQKKGDKATVPATAIGRGKLSISYLS